MRLRPIDAPNDGSRRIRELLKRLTSGQIAQKLLCDISTVCRYAQGRRSPERAVRQRCDEIYGIPIGSWEEPNALSLATSGQPRQESANTVQ
jgi:transcriptional regulator with XRE-family HTH domain